MTRETVTAKAHRLLTSGHLVVEVAARDVFAATVAGDSGIHHVAYVRGGWDCSCPARGQCAHRVAARLIASPGRPS